MLRQKLLFIAFFYFTMITANGQVIFEKSKVILAGKIEQATDRTLIIINHEIVGSEKLNIKINDDGSFHKVFNVLSSHDSYIKYNNDMTTIFLNPGDSLYITANGEDFEHTIQFSGSSARSNIVLHRFFGEFADLASSENFINIMFNRDPFEAKKSFLSFFQKLDQKIEEIEKEHQPNHKILNWMKAYSKYRLGEELLQVARRSKEITPDSFYDFIEANNNDHSEGDFYCSQYYKGFLTEYFQYLMKKNKKAHPTPKTFFEIFSELDTPNTAAELYFTRTLNETLRRDGYQYTDSIFKEYGYLVSNQGFRNYLQEVISEKLNKKYYSIEDLVAFDFIGEVFSEIRDKHQGKVLYIDFWGTWCSPCLREFPASNALHDEFKNDDISFIYLCTSSNKEDWQKVIQKYELGGSHYLLDDDQYNTMAGKFNFSGVPIYMIIDKEGNVVDTYASRPSDERTRAKLILFVDD